ncbi:SdpA family antimicrobial peptide system protein [Micromonospora sp. AKA38]|uniref:SdpA family antimicrobial peptide system protein n=1 Tax=Micromonospora sp. AKA38 TaxID=2733861 RepID=UPI0022C03B43|nr:SdpA family antimicrobial peptide system protein [Micromonospora sp. AKA38]GHJ15485.1 hypothetical protein TPA0908_34800 [Micromonospora sp. AKA38]
MRRLLIRRNVAGLLPPDGEQAGDDPRRASFTFHRMLLLTLLALACVVQWLPGNGAGAPHQLTVKHLWPQTWSFYTDVAGGTEVSAYRWPTAGSKMPELLITQKASWTSLGGLRRLNQAQLAELARLSAQIPEKGWYVCPDERLAACLPSSHRPDVEIVNDAPWPTLCGDIVIAVERRTPDHAVRVERLALTELSCSPR